MNDQSALDLPIHWDDDILGRHEFARFLSQSVATEAKVFAANRDQGLAVTLDADWGGGKSFFVSRWAQDLRAAGHPVVLFDAWQNDLGTEAATALMAAINVEIETWRAKLKPLPRVQREVARAAGHALSDIRRALLPASKVIATSLLKKASGIAVDEIMEAISQTEEKSDKDISEAATNALEAGLDEVFKRALAEHHARSQAISSFKDSITRLLEILASEGNAKLPLFVLVDEVDRCRPTYALRLLEEIKHVFGAKHTCFVVSTNLSQLRESVCAVYGTGFDGHRYLTRFFDRFYTLPDPDNLLFAKQLFSDPCVITNRPIVSGLPEEGEHNSPAHVFAFISRAFALDLRLQKHVFALANSAAAGLEPGAEIHLLWLFFLAALRQRKPELFDEFSFSKFDHTKFTQLMSKALASDLRIEYDAPSANGERRWEKKSTDLSTVMLRYRTWCDTNPHDARRQLPDFSQMAYLDRILAGLLDEQRMGRARFGDKLSIQHYARLVKFAGAAAPQ